MSLEQNWCYVQKKHISCIMKYCTKYLYTFFRAMKFLWLHTIDVLILVQTTLILGRLDEKNGENDCRLVSLRTNCK